MIDKLGLERNVRVKRDYDRLIVSTRDGLNRRPAQLTL